LWISKSDKLGTYKTSDYIIVVEVAFTKDGAAFDAVGKSALKLFPASNIC